MRMELPVNQVSSRAIGQVGRAIDAHSGLRREGSRWSRKAGDGDRGLWLAEQQQHAAIEIAVRTK